MRLFTPGLAFIFLFAQTVRAAEVAPAAVPSIRPEVRDVVRWIRLPGTVAADAEVTLYVKVSGFLKDFTADIGDRVKPGQVIGRLDAPELEQEVRMAEAQLASAQADVATAQAQLASEQLGGQAIEAKGLTLQAELLKARAEASRSQKEFERVQKLATKNAATERERDFQEFSAQIGQAGVQVAERQLGALKPERDLWKKSVESRLAALEAAKAKAAIAKAALERARIMNAYTSITVPAIGIRGGTAIVTKRFVSNGDLVIGGTGPRSGLQPVLTLTSLDPVRVVAELPEQESGFVTSATVAAISFYATKDKPVITRISRTGGILASEARTLRVELDVPNPDGRIKPGMMASIEAAMETHKAVLAVPASSVLIEKKGASVFTVEGGKAKAIPVELGFQDHGIIEVRAAALTAATPLIQDVQAGIADGIPVTLK